jgi:hypothetical protein
MALMYRNKSVAVIVHAYGEEYLIDDTLFSLPQYVDKIDAVNDRSSVFLCLRDKSPRSIQLITIECGAWIVRGCIVIQGVDIGDIVLLGTRIVVSKTFLANFSGCWSAG